MTQTEFNSMYWLHQPPEVRDIKDVHPDERLARALSLALKGFIIDKPIMVDGWDPYSTMSLRALYHFTWTNSLMQQPISVAPDLGGVGDLIPYDPKNPPKGSIKVSLDAEDYAPFDPPTPPTPPSPMRSPVGAFIGTVDGEDMYANLPWDATKDGDVIQDPRGNFVKHSKLGPFGPWGFFVPQKKG